MQIPARPTASTTNPAVQKQRERLCLTREGRHWAQWKAGKVRHRTAWRVVTCDCRVWTGLLRSFPSHDISFRVSLLWTKNLRLG
jgi:hypothetical protein